MCSKPIEESSICQRAKQLADTYNKTPCHRYSDEDVERDVVEFMSCLSKNVNHGHMNWTSGKKIFDILRESTGKDYSRVRFDRVMDSLVKSGKVDQDCRYNGYGYFVYKPAQ